MRQSRLSFRNRPTQNDAGIQRMLYADRLVVWSVWLALMAGLISPAHALIQLTADTGPNTEIIIAGLLINGTDTGDAIMLAVSDQGYQVAINLDDFVAGLNLEKTSADTFESILTPIGQADFPHRQMQFINGTWYAPIDMLTEKLVSSIIYNPRELAISVEPAWPLDQAPPAAEIVQPQKRLPPGGVDAPDVSLSQFRTELQYQFREPSNTAFSRTDIAGGFYGGIWRAQFRNYVDGEGRIEDYTFLWPGQNQRILVGNQSVSVNPLLRGFEFTGAQYAWTNEPELLFNANLQFSQLIASPFSATQTITGEGPPGGIAELRIEGRVIGREIVRLDGSYVFPEVDVAGLAEQQIEVWLYTNRNDTVPEKIIDHSRFVSNQTLPAGTLLQQGGIGIEGNLIEGDLGDQELAGFYRIRYAPTENLVIESAFQSAFDENAGAFTALANLGKYGGIAETGIASDGDSIAWSATVQNRVGKWFWQGALRHEESGYLDRDEDFDNRFGELGRDITERLQLSVVARDLDDEQRDFAYVLPAARWRPLDNFAISIRPDFEGDYTLNTFWGISPRQQFTASLNEELSIARWDFDTSLRRRLSIQGLHREGNGASIGITWQQARTGIRQVGWATGLFFGSGNIGFLAQADYEWIGGLYTRAEVFRDPLNEVNGSADTVYTLSLVMDFALFNGGLSRGRFQRELRNVGAIAGRLRIPEDYINGELAGIGIMVDGQLRGRTQANGSYSIQTLRPGVYSVQLDIGELPLELSPVNTEYWVEIAGGSVTQIDFDLALRLGFAGQALDTNGQPVAAALLEISNRNRSNPVQVTTNAFGFYRVDDLPPGDYQLSWIQNDTVIATRRVVLRNQFLFQQNLHMDIADQE